MTPKKEASLSRKPARVVTLRDETKAMFRTAILATAERVFDEVGYHSARIQDIAEEARIGVGTVYNHFAQKEDMLRAIIDERGAEIERVMAPRPGDPSDWESRLRLRFHRMAGFIEEHRHFFRIMCDLGLFGNCRSDSQQLLGPRYAERHARKMAEAEALLEEGIASGALAKTDARRLARFLGGAMRNVIEDALRSGRQDLKSEADEVWAMFMRAARSTKGAR